MAHSGIDRMSAAKSEYPVQSLGQKRGRLHVRKPQTKEEIENDSPPNTIVVEQWICFLLGFACMTCGAWGICMRAGHVPLPQHIASLRSLYLPALRFTAAACLGSGLVLIRRGWSHL